MRAPASGTFSMQANMAVLRGRQEGSALARRIGPNERICPHCRIPMPVSQAFYPGMSSDARNEAPERKRILVVSRDPEERKHLCEAASGFGDLLLAEDGTDTVAWATQVRIDVMVLDVRVGRISGRDILRLLGLPPHIKVILVADSTDNDLYWPGDPDTPVINKQASTEYFRLVLSAMLASTGSTGEAPAWRHSAAC